MRRAAEYQAAVAEMRASGDFVDFEARLKSCETDEERRRVRDDKTNAINKEVMRRRDPELWSLLDQFHEQLEQDGKLEEFETENMPEEVRNALRKK